MKIFILSLTVLALTSCTTNHKDHTKRNKDCDCEEEIQEAIGDYEDAEIDYGSRGH